MFKDSKVFSDKPILVASPPSSGSTLLAVMLDNHPLISCGPETSLMGNPLFYNKPNMLNVYLDLFSAINSFLFVLQPRIPSSMLLYRADNNRRYQKNTSILALSNIVHQDYFNYFKNRLRYLKQ